MTISRSQPPRLVGSDALVLCSLYEQAGPRHADAQRSVWPLRNSTGKRLVDKYLVCIDRAWPSC
eukprot:652856-Pleurochrysis_carterae.AAC.2